MVGGQDCAWLIFKRVMSWSRGGGGPQKAAQSLTLRTRVHDFVWKNIFTDRVKFRVWRRGCPGLRVARIRCPASLQKKRGGVPCTDPQGVATRTQRQRPEWRGRSQGEPRATRRWKGRKDRKDPPKSFLVVLSHRVCGLLQQEEQAEGKKKNHSSRTGGGRNGQELSPGMLAPVCTLAKGAWGWGAEDAQGRTFQRRQVRRNRVGVCWRQGDLLHSNGQTRKGGRGRTGRWESALAETSPGRWLLWSKLSSEDRTREERAWRGRRLAAGANWLQAGGRAAGDHDPQRLEASLLWL